jgi:AhpD family alkylhydroperoxidase
MEEFEQILKDIAERGLASTTDSWMQSVREEYGQVPYIFEQMAEHPSALISHLLYRNEVERTSKLDPKVIELVSIAAAAALRCPHCTRFHMKAAQWKGATRDEILEVILIAGLMANAAVLATSYRVADEHLDKCSACEIGSHVNKI